MASNKGLFKRAIPSGNHKNPEASAKSTTRTLAAKKKVGRPLTMEPESLKVLRAAIREGQYLGSAFAIAGIPPQTGNNWMVWGKKDIDKYQEASDQYYEALADPLRSEPLPQPPVLTQFAKFRMMVDKQRALAEKDDLLTIRKAANRGNWQASAWRLERRNPDGWGMRNRVQLEGNPENPVQVEAKIQEVRVVYVRDWRAVREDEYLGTVNAEIEGAASDDS